MRLLLSTLLLISTHQVYAQNLDWVVNASYPEGYNFSSNAPNSTGMTIAVDSSGNTVVAGVYTEILHFGEDEQLISPLTQTMFIAKYNSDGNLIWLKDIKGGDPEQNQFGQATPSKIMIDNDSNILITGIFLGQVDFDPSANEEDVLIASSNLNNNFILKLTSQGNLAWVKHFHENQDGAGLSVVDFIIAEDNNLAVVGRFNEFIVFDGDQILHSPISPSSNGFNYYLLKLSDEGDLLWSNILTNSDVTLSEVSFLAYTENQIGLNICVNNYFGAIDFNIYPYLTDVVAGLKSIRTIFFNDLGQPNDYVELLQNANGFIKKKVDMDYEGNFLLYGNLTGAVDFDKSDNALLLENFWPSQSIVVAKYSPTGNLLWAKQLESSTLNLIFGTADIAGNSFILGKLNGNIDFDPNNGVFSQQYSGPMSEVFLLKLDDDGNLRSAKMLGVHNQTFGQLACSSNAHIYYTGCYSQEVSFAAFGSDITINNDAPVNFYNALVCSFSQGECADLSPFIAFSSPLDCMGSSGIAEADAIGGTSPYSYSWNTQPPTLSNIVEVETSGIYTVTVTDEASCVSSVGVYIHGPDIVEYYDLSTHIIANNTSFVPGLLGGFRIYASNEGCVGQSGILQIILDPLTDYFMSSIPPFNISGDTLFFETNELNFGNLPFFVDIEVIVDITALIGEKLCFSSKISPTNNDYNLLNNESALCRFVQVSYDPNLKSVYPVGECEEHYVELDQKLTYTVQFQNTGTFAAINIAVMDTLSSLFDINTLRVVHSSHDMITEVYDDHILKFKFPNIYLADSASNEAESHGYIIFEIEPKSTIASGSVVENKVAIYFDYNQPVVTNTVFNTFVNSIPECVVSLDEVTAKNGSLLLYPNPVGDMMTVVLKDKSIKGTTIRISDITGKVIEHRNHNVDGNIVLNTSDLESGVYLLTLLNGQEIQSVRFVKQ